MKNVIKLLVIFWLSTAVTCEKKERENCHPSIRFSNNSTKSVRANYRVLHPVHYPNPISALETLSYTAQHEMYKINSGEQNNTRALRSRDCIEHIFNRSDGFLDTLYLFVFDAAVIENTSWDIVVRDQLFLKRYDLTLQDLQRLNWQVTYPPTEAMRDVKQYPPFGQ